MNVLTRIPLVALVAVLVSVLVSGCDGGAANDDHRDNPNPVVKSEIDAMLVSDWEAFQTKWAFSQGGVAVRLMTPTGNYFSQVGLGSDHSDALHFRGASTTKTFTAAAVMLLHQQGLLDIDHTVDALIPGTSQPYLPATGSYAVPHKSGITIRQLLGHRAGVFDVTNDPIPVSVQAPYAGQYYVDYVLDRDADVHRFTFDELVGVVASNKLSYFAPESGFHYSNTGYSMLGKIIERVSGLSYAEYVSVTFLKPLGLAQTRFPNAGHHVGLPVPFAEGFTMIGGQIYETTQANSSRSVAEGNVTTTPSDLSLWGHLLLSGKAGLNASTVAMMMDVLPTDEHHQWYGLGVTYTEDLGYGHNGGTAGYMTLMRYDPESEVSVVVFSSLLLADALYEQGDLLVAVAKQAKRLSGY